MFFWLSRLFCVFFLNQNIVMTIYKALYRQSDHEKANTGAEDFFTDVILSPQ